MTIRTDTVNTVLTKKTRKLNGPRVTEKDKPIMTERERRLQQALRDNLRKRKAQTREIKSDDKAGNHK